MGVETRKVSLPAPTDSPTEQTAGESNTEVDLATDVSRRTDKTSYTIPEDGREITVSSKKRRGKSDKASEQRLTHNSSPSQTSLLIEYFEGGKGPNVSSRPSVRVKVTPSAARKIKNENEHIKVSESRGGRKPSYTRRVSLGPHTSGEKQVTESADDKSTSSYTSAAEDSSLAHRNAPVSIEVMHRDQDSDLSRSTDPNDDRLIRTNPSEISSMPPDSMLEEKRSDSTPKNRSRSTSRDAQVNTTDTLKTPSRRRSRSLSKERLAHKAAEKVAAKSGNSGKHRRSSKASSSRSASTEHVDTLKTPRRRSSRHHDDEPKSATESSLLTESQLSPKRQSGDQYSFRSGTSKSSINANPKLLETVENAIRRLIMPEVEALKQEQKIQKTRQKFEQDSVTSGSTEKVSRKLSTHRSAPDVTGKPKVVLNRDEHDPGTVLSGDSIKGRKEHRRSRNSDSPRQRTSERDVSEETVIHDGDSALKKRSREGHRLRDSPASGSLTTAALSHHDMRHSESRSSVDSKERRRRRRSKSHSRSASIAESEDAFRRHDVPPMPMQSDIHSSDMTRDSILSDETDRTKSPAYELQKAEVRQMARASPREISSGSGHGTPTKGRTSLHKSLGTHHSNRSQGDLSQESPRSDRSPRGGGKTSLFGGGPATAGAGSHHTPEIPRRLDDEYRYVNDGRGLSPIQSVSSRQESEVNRDSFVDDKQRRKSAASGHSETSVASAAFDRTSRPKGIHLEPGEDVLDQHNLRRKQFEDDDHSDKEISVDEWLQREHEKNDQYRSSIGEDSYQDPTVEFKHMTNYTDDSMDTSHLDQVTGGQKHQSVDARKNPDYRATPVAVESAVASLLDTSVVSNRSKQADAPHMSSPNRETGRDSTHSASCEVHSKEGQSPGTRHLSPQRSYLLDAASAKGSPRQSIAKSDKASSEHIPMTASGLPQADDPLPEIGHHMNSDSDISTNPSIIQGPMAGTPSGNRDHWPYQPTPPQPKENYLSHSKDSSAHQSLKNAAAGFLSAAALASSAQGSQEGKPRSHDWSVKDDYQPRIDDDYTADHGSEIRHESYAGSQGIPSPPKDEGYVSGPQRGVQSPGIAFKDAASFNDGALEGEDDPFVGKSHARHLSTNSGLARGVGSPLYDSATGNGLDRIQSKDIVALMDHLTVRDAQRNARDTEILITLVRSAAEMRNSFEEMKKFIAEQDDIMVQNSNQQHDRTVQKIVLGGPRPQPPPTPKFSRRGSADEEDDAQTKRTNVFRRALKGLGGRNQTDLTKVEDMLAHLLGEVESLKNGQEARPSAGNTRSTSLDSYHKMRAMDPTSHEPQVQAGSPSAGHSGYFSTPPSRGPSAMKSMGDRQASQNRVSTVLEADEELDEHEHDSLDNGYENDDQLLTPTRENPRPGSVPLATPPQAKLAAAVAKSTDNTPKTSTEKSRKHKSSSSSIFPKVSRWSKTTASSFGDNFRNSGRKERPYSSDMHSRSGELHAYDINDHYDPQGEDRIRSNTSLANDHPPQTTQTPPVGDNRPPSPLIPSEVSEDPKYQAHRNSLNLQHPQPRQGPTHRYQTHLESQAQNYGPNSRSFPGLSPTSDTFGSDPTLSRFMPGGGGANRYSMSGGGHLSPISDAGHSEASASEQAPPRPPKVKDEGPLIPSPKASPSSSRAHKLAVGENNRPRFASPLSQEHLGAEQRYSTGSAADEAKSSPRTTSTTGPPQRKPTGPRPITSSGSWSPEKEGAGRRRRGVAANPGAGEDETF